MEPMLQCRVCGSAIAKGESYRLFRVEGARSPGKSYHHEYAHSYHEQNVSVGTINEAVENREVSAERQLLCLAVCSGISTEELREIAALGGLKMLI